MAMFVNTNVSGLNAQRNLQNVTDRMNNSFEKLSSGSRINSARDDSAGLQIADRLTTQITGLNQANRNANDGISIAQIAEGAMSEITNNVQRMRQLAVQGGNRTLAQDDRDALGEEFKKLMSVNDSIADRTAYGSIKLLNYDSNEGGFQIQTGAQSGQQDTVTTGNAKLTSLFGQSLAEDSTVTGTISTLSTDGLSDAGMLGKITAAYMVLTHESIMGDALDKLFGVDVAGVAANLSEIGDASALQFVASELARVLTNEASATPAGGTDDSDLFAAAELSVWMTMVGADANSLTGFTDGNLNLIHNFATDTLLDAMSDMVTQVDRNRAKLGAEQNGLSSTIRSNSASIVNVSDARARIQDTDFATETAELTRNQIIQQAATSILSQANQLPNAALSLLR
jgi:flagellin